MSPAQVFYGRLVLAALLYIGAIYLMQEAREGWGWSLFAGLLVTPFWSPARPAAECKCADED